MLRIYRFKKGTEDCFGYVDTKTHNIFIRNDLKKVDYMETLFHEFIHWIIIKLCRIKDARKFLHCSYDVIDILLGTFNFKLVRIYFKYYYGK